MSLETARTLIEVAALVASAFGLYVTMRVKIAMAELETKLERHLNDLLRDQATRKELDTVNSRLEQIDTRCFHRGGMCHEAAGNCR